MPRTVEQNEALRAATRRKLIDAARVLFARHGYSDTSIRLIARHAGVAMGLLYSHFDTKEALLRAVFEESIAQVHRSFDIADSAPEDGRIAALVRSSVQLVRENVDVWRLTYAARTQPTVLDALRPFIGSWSDSILEKLRVFLTSAGSPSPDLDARALFAQIDGMCQHFALDTGGYPFDAIADRVIARWSHR